MIVDAVVTWVDGNDPVHVHKRQQALRLSGASSISALPAGRDPTRFVDNGELRHCLASIRRFAPWIRTIHLVTDKQRPAFLTDALMAEWRVSIADHEQIFGEYGHVLPTFNSISIETALHRIPGLADHYLYLNDDFLLLADVMPEDFFREGRVVLRGAWHRLESFGRLRTALSATANRIAKKLFNINRAMSLLQQMRAARIAGMQDRYYKAPHVPHPLRRTTLQAFFARSPEHFTDNIAHPFRDLRQFVATFLANHLEIRAGNAILEDDADAVMICFNRDRRQEIASKTAALEAGRYRFLCVQSLEQASQAQRQALFAVIERRLAR